MKHFQFTITRRQERQLVKDLFKQGCFMIENFDLNPVTFNHLQDFVTKKFNTHEFFIFHPSFIIRELKEYIDAVDCIHYICRDKKDKRIPNKGIKGNKLEIFKLFAAQGGDIADCFGNPHICYYSGTDYFSKRLPDKPVIGRLYYGNKYFDPNAMAFHPAPKAVKAFYNELCTVLQSFTGKNG